MKKIVLVIGIVIFISAFIFVSIFYSTKNVNYISGDVVKETLESQIHVGVLAPLTGLRADGGEYCRRGIELALSEINNEINIEKKRYGVSINYEDTQYDSKLAVSAIRNLISLESVHYIVGAYSSPETLAIAPIAQENKIILITPTAQASDITNAGDYIFRTQISVNQEAPFWAEFIKKRVDTGDLSIIAINNDYGLSYLDVFMKFYPKEDINNIYYYDSKETDFRTLLMKIKYSESKNLLILATPKNTGTILKQLSELDMHLDVYTTSPAEAKELLSIAQESAEGLMFPSPYDETSTVYSMREYREKYYDIYSQTPEMISANCYDSLKIFALCFDRYGDDVENVKKCIYGLDGYRGASGILSFDENGDVHKDLIVKTVINGEFVKYVE